MLDINFFHSKNCPILIIVIQIMGPHYSIATVIVKNYITNKTVYMGNLPPSNNNHGTKLLSKTIYCGFNLNDKNEREYLYNLEEQYKNWRIMVLRYWIIHCDSIASKIFETNYNIVTFHKGLENTEIKDDIESWLEDFNSEIDVRVKEIEISYYE